jgi:hypothetical protein
MIDIAKRRKRFPVEGDIHKDMKFGKMHGDFWRLAACSHQTNPSDHDKICSYMET